MLWVKTQLDLYLETNWEPKQTTQSGRSTAFFWRETIISSEREVGYAIAASCLQTALYMLSLSASHLAFFTGTLPDPIPSWTPLWCCCVTHPVAHKYTFLLNLWKRHSAGWQHGILVVSSMQRDWKHTGPQDLWIKHYVVGTYWSTPQCSRSRQDRCKLFYFTSQCTPCLLAVSQGWF